MRTPLCVVLSTTNVKTPLYQDDRIVSIFPAWRGKRFIYRVKFKQLGGETFVGIVLPEHINWVVANFSFEDLTNKQKKS